MDKCTDVQLDNTIVPGIVHMSTKFGPCSPFQSRNIYSQAIFRGGLACIYNGELKIKLSVQQTCDSFESPTILNLRQICYH